MRGKSFKVKTAIFIALIVAVLIIIAAVVFFYLPLIYPKTADVIYINNDFDDEVAKSIDRFYSDVGLADIISGTQTDKSVMAITFAGMTEPDLMYSVLDIVKQYNIKCTFFLEGAEVAEYSPIVTAIEDSGNEIGSYTLYGDKYMDENLTYDMIEDFVYSSSLIGREASAHPVYLMCNNSRYTDNLLKAVTASGFEYIVEPTHILNYQSFSTYEMAYNYIKRLPNASVVSIKMKGVLDENEYAPPVKTQDIGKEAGIDENNSAQLLGEKERLLNVVEWVCRAIRDIKRDTVRLDVLPKLPPVLPQVAIADNKPAPVPSSSQKPAMPKPAIPKPATPKPAVPKPPAVMSAAHEQEQLAQLRKEAILLAVENLRVENAGKHGQLLKLATTYDRALNYIFYGIANENALDNVLSDLAALDKKGTFFVSEDDIVNYPDQLNRIIQDNHNIGIALLVKNSDGYYNTASTLLSSYNFLLSEFNIKTNIVVMPFGETTDDIMEAVSAVRMRMIDFDLAVVRSAHRYETSSDIVIKGIFGDSMNSLKLGSTVYFRLDYYENSDSLAGELMNKVSLYEDVLMNLASLREKNYNQTHEPIKHVYTTEKALAYVFYGIHNQTAVYDVLHRLDGIGCKGTFFVTEADIADYAECVADIAMLGHEIGIALPPRSDADFYSYGTTLIGTSELLSKRYGINEPLIMIPYGTPDNTLKEVISALGMTLIEPGYPIVRNADRLATSAYEIMQARFGDSVYMLKRGDIVYFRLDFYENRDTIVGELVQSIKEKLVDPVRYAHDESGDSAYTIKGVGSLLSDNKELLYQYPLPSYAMYDGVANAIYPGHFDGMSDEDIFGEMLKRYIGNPDIISSEQFPGFTDSQIAKLDNKGRIDTGGTNTIFLTFDDWATDLETNHLLYVLKKHGVKASFFIRTNYVASNPNALRAIAADGHDLGSHTVNHVVLSHYNKELKAYETITEQEAKTLEWELTESYNTLASIAGDIINEKGRPVVQRFFRAPTLAQSYIGMKTVMDCGYLYDVSGDFSSGDYEMENPGGIVDILINGVPIPGRDDIRTIEDGSIIVMHISPTARFTAEALDLFLTENEKKPVRQRFNFARLSDFLYE